MEDLGMGGWAEDVIVIVLNCFFDDGGEVSMA